MQEQTRTSNRLLASWLPEARQRLATLGLPPEWSEESVEAPSLRASKSADYALRLLAELGLEPPHLLPSLEGGVSIAFNLEGRYADIQLLNGGEIVTTCSEGLGAAPLGIDAGCNLVTASWRIRSFLDEGKSPAPLRCEHAVRLTGGTPAGPPEAC